MRTCQHDTTTFYKQDYTRFHIIIQGLKTSTTLHNTTQLYKFCFQQSYKLEHKTTHDFFFYKVVESRSTLYETPTTLCTTLQRRYETLRNITQLLQILHSCTQLDKTFTNLYNTFT